MSHLNLREFIESFAGPFTWDELFQWPPDVFAVTSLVLKRTGIYRFVICPPAGREWPPAECLDRGGPRLHPWDRLATEQAQEWIAELAPSRGIPAAPVPPLPQLVACWKRRIESSWELVDVEDLKEIPNEAADDLWPICEALIALHCVADSACAGFGTPISPEAAPYVQFTADHLLAVYGSLSRLPKVRGVVLPKMRTPQTGLTLRALSLYASWHETEVDVHWRSVPLVNPDENTLNVLVLPWPEMVQPRDFRTCLHPNGLRAAGQYRYFEFAPAAPACRPSQVVHAVRRTEHLASRVHALVFPELALTHSDLDAVKQALVETLPLAALPRVIISGVRDWPTEEGAATTAPCNAVVLSVFFAGRWYDLRQGKHHRWKLDARQVEQYNVGGVLASHKGWWEQVHVGRRSLTVFAPTDWLAMTPLICEDLAQLEPVAEVIRGIGPTLVAALLLDGPQLPQRWAAKYASVLADDPGTSVLTVTALGMSARSIPSGPGELGDRTVASWRDGNHTFKAICLKPHERAVLLTLSASLTKEFSADGRSDGGAAAKVMLSGIHYLAFDDAEDDDPPPSDLAVTLQTQSMFRELQRRALDRGTTEDTLELTAFAQAVDASLDATRGDVGRICAAARLCRSEDVIAAVTCPPLPDAARPDIRVEFDNALTYYARLHERLPEGEKEYDRWAQVLALVRGELAAVRQNKVCDETSAAIADLLRDRNAFAVLSTLLWAVHSRLERRRLRGTLTGRGSTILQECEQLLFTT